MATKYVDYEGGNDANSGLSFALRKKTITSASATAAAGDVIRVMASPTPVSIGDATWTNLSATVSHPLRTLTLYNDGAWTPMSSTVTTTTSSKQGANCVTITNGSNTLATYTFVEGTSLQTGYSKLSLWFKSSGDLSAAQAGTLSIVLNGVSGSNFLTFPAEQIRANLWTAITIPKTGGGNFGSGTMTSISLFMSGSSSWTFSVDNVFLTNDLSLTSLISLGSTGDNLWWGVRSVYAGTTLLDQGDQSTAISNPARGFVGTTTTGETFCREPIKLPRQTAASTELFTLGTSGSAGNPITISGGWDRTSMASRTSETLYSGQCSWGRLFGIAGRSYNTLDRFLAKSMYEFVDMSGVCRDNIFSNCHAVGMGGTQAFNLVSTHTSTAANIQVTGCSVVQGVGGGITITTGALPTLSNVKCHSNTGSGIVLQSAMPTLNDVSCTNNATFGINATGAFGAVYNTGTISNNGSSGLRLVSCYGFRVNNLTANSNTTGAIAFTGSHNNSFFNLATSGNLSGVLRDNGTNGDNYFYNWVRLESETGDKIPVTFTAYQNSRFISTSETLTGSIVRHAVYVYGGVILSNVTTRHTNSGIAWLLKPYSTTTITSLNPITHQIGPVAVKANIPVTASIWVRRQSASTVGVFRILGGQVAGVASTLTVAASAAINTWEQLTLATFTPTADGVVEFEVTAYGVANASFYWDDFAVSTTAKLATSSGDYGWIKTGVYVNAGLPVERRWTFNQ